MILVDTLLLSLYLDMTMSSTYSNIIRYKDINYFKDCRFKDREVILAFVGCTKDKKYVIVKELDKDVEFSWRLDIVNDLLTKQELIQVDKKTVEALFKQ